MGLESQNGLTCLCFCSTLPRLWAAHPFRFANLITVMRLIALRNVTDLSLRLLLFPFCLNSEIRCDYTVTLLLRLVVSIWRQLHFG